MRTSLLVAAVCLCAQAQVEKKRLPEVPAELREELVGYLKAHWKSPEDYIVSKFASHNLVFLGEYHRIRHDVELVGRLIPRLYKMGVRNLGIEFGAAEFQAEADRLVTAAAYDESVARSLMHRWSVIWGYREYIDLYRRAWELNHSLPPDALKFRIVHLNYRAQWDLLEEPRTPEMMKKVFHRGDPDWFMADVIQREFLAKKEKALIYSGSHHSFTKYRQPVWDYASQRLVRLAENRMGNHVYRAAPGGVFNVHLHSPWMQKAKPGAYDYPVRGVIDAVMRAFPEPRVGFDVVASPFARLGDDTSVYSAGYDPFTFAEFCDGYIYQKRLSKYEGVSVDPDFVTEANFRETLAHLPAPAMRAKITSAEMYRAALAEDADIPRRMRGFE